MYKKLATKSYMARIPPNTKIFIGVTIFLGLGALLVWVNPSTYSLKTADEIAYSTGGKDYVLPTVYASDKNTVCEYSNSENSKAGELGVTYFTPPETYQNKTYYPLGQLSQNNGYGYGGSERTITCNTNDKLLVKSPFFISSDMRLPVLVLIGVCYLCALGSYIFLRLYILIV